MDVFSSDAPLPVFPSPQYIQQIVTLCLVHGQAQVKFAEVTGNKKEDTLYLKCLNMCFQLIAIGFAVIIYF